MQSALKDAEAPLRKLLPAIDVDVTAAEDASMDIEGRRELMSADFQLILQSILLSDFDFVHLHFIYYFFFIILCNKILY